MPSPFEEILTSTTKEGMVVYIKKHPNCFDEAIQLILSDKSPYCWRAAWVLNSYIKKNDPRVIPHIQKIIDCFPEKEDGHQRELIRLLMRMNLDEDQEGYLFEHCVNIWEQIGKQSSIRYFAMLYITETIKKYPELKNELTLLTEDHYLEPISSGIRKSVVKLVETINKM